MVHDMSITIRAVHLRGADNVEADRLSRHLSSHEDKRDKSVLRQEIATLLFGVWGSPWVDLFAANDNAKVHVFCSQTAESLAC